VASITLPGTEVEVGDGDGVGVEVGEAEGFGNGIGAPPKPNATTGVAAWSAKKPTVIVIHSLCNLMGGPSGA
jgi:hypothetical protein